MQLGPCELNQDRLNYCLTIFKSERKAHTEFCTHTLKKCEAVLDSHFIAFVANEAWSKLAKLTLLRAQWCSVCFLIPSPWDSSKGHKLNRVRVNQNYNQIKPNH